MRELSSRYLLFIQYVPTTRGLTTATAHCTTCVAKTYPVQSSWNIVHNVNHDNNLTGFLLLFFFIYILCTYNNPTYCLPR